MSFNVKNGTPMHGPSLCETCTRAHIVKGYRESEILMLCRATWEPQRILPFAVRECSSYVAKNASTLDDMEKIAWTIAPRGSKRAASISSWHFCSSGWPGSPSPPCRRTSTRNRLR